MAEYGVDLNATQAAIRAGYSRKTAAVIGYENLRKPHIEAAVSAGTAAAIERARLTRAVVLEAIRRQVVADIGDLYNQDGSPKPLHALTVEQRAQITDVEVVLKNVAAGDGHVDTVHRYRREPRAKYVEMAARHFGLIEPENVPPRPPQPLVIILEQRPAGWRGAGGRVVNGQVVPPEEDAKPPT